LLGAINNQSVLLPESIHINPAYTPNADFTLSRSDYLVRLARERSHLHAQASNLVASMYSSRGLGIAGPDLAVFQADRRRRTHTTLAATRGNDVVGTLTLEVDPGNKLLADSLYRRETDALREQGKRLCEVTRLALHPELSCREIMATLFHVTFVLATMGHYRTDMLAEVHPRHAGFYRRTLGFKVLGPERICLRVGAPAVLMHLCLEFAQSQISQLAGTSKRGDRNLYSLFLPDNEQQSLLKQLLAF
jgi:hypothetical protein